MILILLAISIVILIIGIILNIKKGWDEYDNPTGFWVTLVGGILSGTFLMVTLILTSSYADVIATDKKIAMYQEENTKIEAQITTTVDEYMEYEQQTFKNAKPDINKQDVVALVSLYPELKSDELIKTQITTYTSNNREIKELKAERINYEKHLWFLCFYNIN